jgi:ankyrin repeat protein
LIQAFFNRPGIVKILLAKGANPDAKDEDGNTAFDVATDRGSDKVLSLLKNN